MQGTLHSDPDVAARLGVEAHPEALPAGDEEGMVGVRGAPQLDPRRSRTPRGLKATLSHQRVERRGTNRAQSRYQSALDSSRYRSSRKHQHPTPGTVPHRNGPGYRELTGRRPAHPACRANQVCAAFASSGGENR